MRKRQIKKNIKRLNDNVEIQKLLIPFKELRRFNDATRKAQLNAEMVNDAFSLFVKIANTDFSGITSTPSTSN